MNLRSRTFRRRRCARRKYFRVISVNGTWHCVLPAMEWQFRCAMWYAACNCHPNRCRAHPNRFRWPHVRPRDCNWEWNRSNCRWRIPNHLNRLVLRRHRLWPSLLVAILVYSPMRNIQRLNWFSLLCRHLSVSQMHYNCRRSHSMIDFHWAGATMCHYHDWSPSNWFVHRQRRRQCLRTHILSYSNDTFVVCTTMRTSFHLSNHFDANRSILQIPNRNCSISVYFLFWRQSEDLPGVFVRKIGGGGKLVPLIGEMHPLSLISCCKIDRYETSIQNSSKSITISLCLLGGTFNSATSRLATTISRKLSRNIRFCV